MTVQMKLTSVLKK